MCAWWAGRWVVGDSGDRPAVLPCVGFALLIVTRFGGGGGNEAVVGDQLFEGSLSSGIVLVSRGLSSWMVDMEGRSEAERSGVEHVKHRSMRPTQ